MDIGFIGLGKMGFPMARRLVEAKHQLVVFDQRKEAVDKLGQWREQTGITRVYLQLHDLADLDQIELIASEVMPQLR